MMTSVTLTHSCSYESSKNGSKSSILTFCTIEKMRCLSSKWVKAWAKAWAKVQDEEVCKQVVVDSEEVIVEAITLQEAISTVEEILPQNEAETLEVSLC
jgi:hypothetical protein